VFDQDPKAFWTVYDFYFTHQKDITADNLKDKTLEAIKDTKVDAGKFKECYDGKKTLDRVKADQAEGGQVGVNGTPAFFINGRFLNGAVPAQQFKEIIDDELKKGGAKG
jgi:protein-disulfide isomerase